MNRGGHPLVFITMRHVRVGLAAATILVLLTGTGLAGGSWIESYRDNYRPGETVVMRGDVSPGQLGWVDDGPFYAYLRVDPNAAVGANTFPYIDESDLYLGELVLEELSSGWIHVSLMFTLPADIPDGEYSVTYCNDPCTEGLGDLAGGYVKVAKPSLPVRHGSAFLFPV